MGNRWIPTTERLPNQREFIESYVRSAYAAEFLVTIEGADKATTLYYSQTGVWFDEELESRHDAKALERFKRPAYQSVSVAEYLAKKYDITAEVDTIADRRKRNDGK